LGNGFLRLAGLETKPRRTAAAEPDVCFTASRNSNASRQNAGFSRAA
jgi:hypothetical protein